MYIYAWMYVQMERQQHTHIITSYEITSLDCTKFHGVVLVGINMYVCSIMRKLTDWVSFCCWKFASFCNHSSKLVSYFNFVHDMQISLSYESHFLELFYVKSTNNNIFRVIKKPFGFINIFFLEIYFTIYAEFLTILHRD